MKKITVLFITLMLLLIMLPISVFAMQVNVSVEYDGTTLSFEADPTDSIENLKAKIQEATTISPELQILTYEGRILQEGTTFSDNGIGDGATVQLALVSTQAEYTVTFVSYDGSVVSEQRVKEGEDAAAPQAPVRPGYTFVGWDGDYTGVTEDRTLTARWAVKIVVITYEAGGGRGFMVPSQGIAPRVAPCAFKRPGYVFKGWIDENGNPAAVGSVAAESTTLTAQWTKRSGIHGNLQFGKQQGRQNGWGLLDIGYFLDQLISIFF